jgi:hypothetical protein
MEDGVGMLLTFVEDFGKREVDPLDNLDIAESGISHYYVNNYESGRALVVEGVVTNSSEVPKGHIQVLLTLYDPSGASLGTYTAYCGDVLAIKELESLSQEQIRGHLSQPSGNGLRIEPGGTVQFMLVIFNVPANTSGYNVTILSAQNVG